MIRLGVLTLLLIAAPFALYLLHQTGTTLGEAGRRSAALRVVPLDSGSRSPPVGFQVLQRPRRSGSRSSRCSPSG